jgi:hypothetical protein
MKGSRAAMMLARFRRFVQVAGLIIHLESDLLQFEHSALVFRELHRFLARNYFTICLKRRHRGNWSRSRIRERMPQLWLTGLSEIIIATYSEN